MSELLKFINTDPHKTKQQIQDKIKAGYAKIPLFTPLKELGNKTLYDYMRTYGKLRKLTLANLVEFQAVNIEERNADEYTLIQLFIEQADLPKIKMMLKYGARLTQADLDLTSSQTVLKFFNYRPGRGQISIFEFCKKRFRPSDYQQKVNALLLDEADTTDNDSSDAESFSEAELSTTEKQQLASLQSRNVRRYNEGCTDVSNSLCLVAARGVHFSPKYFSKTASNKVKATKKEQHTTLSQSTLFDAGYSADDEVSESDRRIVTQDKKNRKFISDLKAKQDKKEKRVGNHLPSASRNKQQFDNLLYRFLQVYINSYNRMFNIGTIKSDFNFYSLRNPLVSASWSIPKSTMYASGFRFDWSARDLRRCPHYRRFTAKPKHPNLGYVDIFAFDIDFVRKNGFDRQLMCSNGYIGLSAFYRAEAEIIFVSMIPKKYHNQRCLISLPDFSRPFTGNASYFKSYGIRKSTYSKFKKVLTQSDIKKKDDDYRTNINLLTEKASTAQAVAMQNIIELGLFRSSTPRVIVYDHGDSIQPSIFKL